MWVRHHCSSSSTWVGHRVRPGAPTDLDDPTVPWPLLTSQLRLASPCSAQSRGVRPCWSCSRRSPPACSRCHNTNPRPEKAPACIGVLPSRQRLGQNQRMKKGGGGGGMGDRGKGAGWRLRGWEESWEVGYMRTQGGQWGRGERIFVSSGRYQNENSHWGVRRDPEAREGTRRWKGLCALRVLGYWGLSTHWLGLAPEASRSRTIEVWPSSADRKSPVCPAEFSPSTWTTEGHQSLKLCSLHTPGSLPGHQTTHTSCIPG